MFNSSDKINVEESDKDIEAYLNILEEYKTKQFADPSFDLMKRVEGALNRGIETVLNSFGYLINSYTQAEWDNFTKIRNSLLKSKAQDDRKPLIH